MLIKNCYLMKIKLPPKRLVRFENWGSFPIDTDNIAGYLSTGKELLCWKIICCCYNILNNLTENP